MLSGSVEGVSTMYSNPQKYRTVIDNAGTLRCPSSAVSSTEICE